MRRSSGLVAVAAATTATAATLLVADLAWLGVVARRLYDAQLSTLRRADTYLPAAALFYALYVAAIVAYAAIPSNRVSQAARRGAGMGLLAYGTYELTNWAVLRDWPALLVPVDLAWGVIVTAAAAAAGHWAFALSRRSAQ